MKASPRHRFPWSTDEINRLHNEYEIKQLDIATIAHLHGRSEYAILYKLADESLIHESWNDVRGWDGWYNWPYHEGSEEDEDEDADVEEFDPYDMSQKVDFLYNLYCYIHSFLFSKQK